jgi:hypothetical protein
MNNIFRDLIMEGVVVVYLDDILIFMETLEEHRRISESPIDSALKSGPVPVLDPSGLEPVLFITNSCEP